jgi:cbb3-type cytochrome oxidase subunit 3
MRTGFKGTGALIIAAALFVALAIAIRSFFVVVIAAAFAAVVILHFWNKRPVKTPEDDQVRLHLNDDVKRDAKEDL